MTELKAGRELDALVAEKVMGWRYVESTQNRIVHFMHPQIIDSDSMRGELRETKRRSSAAAKNAPAYSTDIAAAWQVVVALLNRTPQRDLHLQHLDGIGWGVSCCFNKTEGGWDGWVYANTAPLSICLAALKAVEFKPQ